MAMTLNLTLVVQMINFLIAYYFISKVLLRPAYEAVKSDENKARQLHALIEAEQEQLGQKNDYKNRRWQMCRNQFYKNKPSLEEEEVLAHPSKMIEPAPEMTDARIDSEAHAIAEALKQRVLK